MTDITPPSSPQPRISADEMAQLREVRLPFATSRTVFALMLREMSTSYGRSPGGYIWAVLEPVAGIAILTAIFSAGFRHPPLGTSFPLFYATGILTFLIYSDVAGKLSQTLNFSRALLEYPRVTFVDALLARFILNTLTQFMVHFLVMTGVILLFVGDVSIDLGKAALAYVIVLTLAVGIGTLNGFLVVAYPVWQSVWAVLNRPMFLISCMFFLFETVPQPYQDMLWYNPLVHPIGMMRDAYYPYYNPTYISVAYPMLIGASMMLAGLFLLNRYHRDILDK
ncbi:ABC transporter permease [Roseovarius sp. 2305UL8-3]|uniref:ABC transporter permease n=1 Tax=Roseovarius conchicola TaxID=3121636 RepID=UPI003528886D